MTLNTNIFADADGQTLDTLAGLIAQRTKLLGETTEDAVIATAINILSSLRADTLDARKGDKADPPKRISPRGDLVVSFSGARHAPVLRDKSGNRVHIDGSLHFAQRGVKAKTLIPIQVVPVHERIKPYFVAASSSSAALKFEGDQIRKRIKAKGGLARAAFSVAMAKISTRNANDNSPRLAKILASQLSTISCSASGYDSGEASLVFRDSLDYAKSVLSSGPSAVSLAVQRAANRTAGMLNKLAAAKLSEPLKTPFPEAKRR